MSNKEILKQLTLEEKVFLLQAKDDWHLNGVERLGIPSVTLTDGPSGVRMSNENFTETLPATAIPTESILSASWDTELVLKLGQMMGRECQAHNVGILLGPGANAKRSPLAGRNFEYYSEDPFLSGKLAAAMIQGVQSQGVGTSMKHFVANDQETRRFTTNVTVDERTLRELLLAPFEIAIKEAKPWTLMGAYPRLRGAYLCENAYILQDVLREEYQYEGVVLSDWGAVVHKVASHQNGLDLETGSYASADELIAAVKSGEISMEVIDTHALRVLDLIEKVTKGRTETPVDWQSHHALARRAAAESMVLLKNEEEILPLMEGSQVAVVGAFAKTPRYGGGGSSGVNPQQMDIPMDFIASLAQAEYAPGYENESVREDLIAEACRIAKGKAAVIVFVGTTVLTESEGSDRTSMLFPPSHVALVQALAKVNDRVIVCNTSGAAMDFTAIEDAAKAIIHMGLPGEGGGAAIADLLFGRANPSGKLTETFPLCLEHTPCYPDFPGYCDEVTYHEGLLQGYRYYDTKKIPVRYPFGYGLSYTSFAYSNLCVSARQIRNKESLEVSVDVTNTGLRDGSEIVQLYVADPQSYMPRPAKELKGFARVFLKAGQTKTVTIKLEERAFAYYVPHLGRYAVESGTFRLLVGASSQDIRLETEVYFASEDEVRLPRGLHDSIGDFYRDSRYAAATKQALEKMGITEDSPMFPIFGSTLLAHLPVMMHYMHLPPELGETIQQMILNGENRE